MRSVIFRCLAIYEVYDRRNREDSSLVGGLRTEDGGHNVNDIMEI